MESSTVRESWEGGKMSCEELWCALCSGSRVEDDHLSGCLFRSTIRTLLATWKNSVQVDTAHSIRLMLKRSRVTSRLSGDRYLKRLRGSLLQGYCLQTLPVGSSSRSIPLYPLTFPFLGARIPWGNKGAERSPETRNLWCLPYQWYCVRDNGSSSNGVSSWLCIFRILGISNQSTMDKLQSRTLKETRHLWPVSEYYPLEWPDKPVGSRPIK